MCPSQKSQDGVNENSVTIYQAYSMEERMGNGVQRLVNACTLLGTHLDFYVRVLTSDPGTELGLILCHGNLIAHFLKAH